MRPLPVQRPRIPIWVAGRAPHTRPLARAKRWDGYVPIADPFLSPDDLAAYVGEHPRDGWDLVAQWAPGVPADEFAAAGVTWLMRSTWPRRRAGSTSSAALAGVASCVSAPAGGRTQTEPLLRRLPLPVGIRGPPAIVSTTTPYDVRSQRPARSRAEPRTSSSMAGVSRPVKVLCCEGW